MTDYIYPLATIDDVLEALDESNIAIAAASRRPAIDQAQRQTHLACLRWWRDREAKQLAEMLEAQR